MTPQMWLLILWPVSLCVAMLIGVVYGMWAVWSLRNTQAPPQPTTFAEEIADVFGNVPVS